MSFLRQYSEKAKGLSLKYICIINIQGLYENKCNHNICRPKIWSDTEIGLQGCHLDMILMENVSIKMVSKKPRLA